MADRTPPAVPDLSPPVGPPRFAWFGGVVEGARSGDDGPLHAATSAIERLGLGRADLEIDGTRFTLLLTGETIDGTRLDESTKEQFIRAIEDLARAAGSGRTLESTLRCTEVHPDRTVETLFAVEERQVRPLSRIRGVDSQDLLHAPRPSDVQAELESLGSRRALLIGSILVVIGGLALWQSGIIRRLTSVDPVGLPILTTEFGERLSVTVVRRFGDYRVEIRRGPSFPDNPQKLAVWQDRISETREGIAYNVITGAATAFVHLLGEDSRRLATVEVDLRSLRVLSDHTVSARLPGHPETTGFAISPVEVWGR
jgi:hypothetical protein